MKDLGLKDGAVYHDEGSVCNIHLIPIQSPRTWWGTVENRGEVIMDNLFLLHMSSDPTTIPLEPLDIVFSPPTIDPQVEISRVGISFVKV